MKSYDLSFTNICLAMDVIWPMGFSWHICLLDDVSASQNFKIFQKDLKNSGVDCTVLLSANNPRAEFGCLGKLCMPGAARWTLLERSVGHFWPIVW
jgi:hypothetical protein